MTVVPYLNLSWIGLSEHISISLFMIALSTLVSVGVIFRELRNENPIKLIFLVFGIAVSALFGGRLMHVAVERPEYFLEHPHEIFSNFRGMVFYGALFLGGLTTWVLLRVFFKTSEVRRAAWRAIAISLALSLCIMRVSCFLEGCCWGFPSAVPWAVRYMNPEGSMPWLGIPVHPVQLYEALGGLFIAIVLIRYSKLSFKHFLIFYALLRLFTEMFRGDTIRGEDVLFSLSTSQVLSSLILLAIFGAKLFEKFGKGNWIMKKRSQVLAAAVLVALGSGCLPQPPSSEVVSQKVNQDQAFEWNVMARQKTVPNPLGRPGMTTTVSIPATGRDAVFVATDDEVQKLFSDKIQAAYKATAPIRIEEVSWWMYAPKFQLAYDRVVRIRYDQFTRENLIRVLKTMEREGRPYDLFLMTHGVPNNLVTSSPNPFFSWEDLGELKGKLKRLELVFMQACFGDTLAKDWHAAGADAVLSFSEFNRNFFYLGFFLEDLRKKDRNFALAQELTLTTVNDRIRRDRVLTQVIEMMGMTVDEYLKTALPPKLTLK